jgi:hypothetical protein
MEIPNQNITPTAVPSTPNVDQLAVDRQKFGENLKKFKEILKAALARLLKNKKMVVLLGGIFGLILLIIILGLIFGKRSKVPPHLKGTPSPNQNTQSPIPSPTDTLGQNEVKLKNMNEEIINFDIIQSRLTPPKVDFKISF